MSSDRLRASIEARRWRIESEVAEAGMAEEGILPLELDVRRELVVLVPPRRPPKRRRERLRSSICFWRLRGCAAEDTSVARPTGAVVLGEGGASWVPFSCLIGAGADGDDVRRRFAGSPAVPMSSPTATEATLFGLDTSVFEDTVGGGELAVAGGSTFEGCSPAAGGSREMALFMSVNTRITLGMPSHTCLLPLWRMRLAKDVSQTMQLSRT